VTMLRAAVVSIGSAPPCPRVISLDETCRLRRKAAASGAINRARCIGNLWAPAGGCRQTEEPSNGAKMDAAALVGEPASLPCRQPRHVDRARGIGGAGGQGIGHAPGPRPGRGQRAAGAWCGVAPQTRRRRDTVMARRLIPTSGEVLGAESGASVQSAMAMRDGPVEWLPRTATCFHGF
jgi:hypothetical protein